MTPTQFTTRWSQHRSQAGFSALGALAAVGATASLATLMALSGNEKIDAAQTTVCLEEKTVIMTAVESYHAADSNGSYPQAIGADGLSEVRAAGWLRNESKYWRFTGLDATGTPQYALRLPIKQCA